MNLGLAGKRVVVTGASHGIGLGIAEGFHLEGCTVVSNGRDEAKLTSSIAKREGWFAVVGDVSDPLKANGVVQQAVDILGGIDILVCNVGSGKSVPPGQESFTDWQKSLSVNLLSTTNMVEAAVSELKKTKGVIVCISSICGVEVVPKAPVTYSVAKAALNAYIRGISVPLGSNGVRINGVAPGNILFEGSVWEEKIKQDGLSVEAMLENNVPLKRLGSLSDISNLVLWLSSPKASFVTGSIYITDGGQTHT
mgnify:CR=1 FL=1